jgi:hypothetical protein
MRRAYGYLLLFVFLFVVAFGSTPKGQDLTTQLALFLVDLRAQALGVNQPITSLRLGATTFATLPSSTNGTILYCSDCTVATAATCPGTQASCICAGSGTGGIARRINSLWYCTF